MLYRIRRRQRPTPPASGAALDVVTDSTAPTPPDDWLPPSPETLDATAPDPGVTLERGKGSPKGKALESARGSHRG